MHNVKTKRSEAHYARLDARWCKRRRFKRQAQKAYTRAERKAAKAECRDAR